MISREALRRVLLDYRRVVEQQKVFRRQVEIGQFPRYVLVGIRRSGKSFLLYQKAQALLAQGKTWDDMFYVNFEDERLMGFDVGDFNTLISVHAEMSGSARLPVMFLDEVQNVSGWERFVRRMADAQAEIYITGSNAKMLSVDVAAALGGRFMILNVFPLSFSELLGAKGIAFDKAAREATIESGLIAGEFQKYLRFGGFPEALNLPTKIEYLNSLFQKIYLSDIAARNKITNLFSLRVMIKKVAESIGQPLSYSRLTNIIRATGAALAKSTCIQYLQATYESCLLIPIQNIVGKLADRESTPKIYFADTGLIELLKFDALSDQLENAVALQLLRLYGVSDEVFFYRRGAEVDFYVPQEGLAVQACVRLGDSPEIIDREVGAFRELAKELPVRRRIIVTLDESRRIETSEVEVTPAWRWLLESEEARRNRPAGGEPSA